MALPVQVWLAKHPRFKLHFIPTSSSWLHLVVRRFAEITRQRIRRGVFTSVADLEAAIEARIAERNTKPKPFKWTEADSILEKNAHDPHRAHLLLARLHEAPSMDLTGPSELRIVREVA